MNNKKFVNGLIELFADKTKCDIQYNNCPCNSCVHSIKADFTHITWLILLGLRGDYEHKIILDDIKKELNK